jgi:hypothetical protein
MSGRYEFSAGGGTRSGLLPRYAMTTRDMASPGNIVSRLRREE